MEIGALSPNPSSKFSYLAHAQRYARFFQCRKLNSPPLINGLYLDSLVKYCDSDFSFDILWPIRIDGENFSQIEFLGGMGQILEKR